MPWDVAIDLGDPAHRVYQVARTYPDERFRLGLFVRHRLGLPVSAVGGLAAAAALPDRPRSEEARPRFRRECFAGRWRSWEGSATTVARRAGRIQAWSDDKVSWSWGVIGPRCLADSVPRRRKLVLLRQSGETFAVPPVSVEHSPVQTAPAAWHLAPMMNSLDGSQRAKASGGILTTWPRMESIRSACARARRLS